MEKIFDINRSIGSIGHKIFGAMLCDECRKPSDNLYQFKLEDGTASEDSYCSSCHDKIASQSAASRKERSETIEGTQPVEASRVHR